jgi:hypothetical protein
MARKLKNVEIEKNTLLGPGIWRKTLKTVKNDKCTL